MHSLSEIGPEHEFSIVDNDLYPLPISDRVIKKLRGRIANEAELRRMAISKELQAHALEFRSNKPFTSLREFEEVIQDGVAYIFEILKDFDAYLLGTGMNPFLKLEDAKVWNHKDKKIYNTLNNVFGIHKHGWLNIQAFQLNLSYSNEKEAMTIYNSLINILPYLPAISASSPIVESKVSKFLDCRLYFYKMNQKRIPSVTGNVIPEYIGSFEEYREKVLGKYYRDLKKINAPSCIIKPWLNSRGEIFKSHRIEIRILDEQECVKSDVALSCFITALLKGYMDNPTFLPYDMLVHDFNEIVKDGLDAKVRYPHASTARDVCKIFYRIAENNTERAERKYLNIIKNRIKRGNLSDCILKNMKKKSTYSVYSSLVKCLEKNKCFF